MTRQYFIRQVAAGSTGLLIPDFLSKQSSSKMIMRSILSTGEKIPAIG